MTDDEYLELLNHLDLSDGELPPRRINYDNYPEEYRDAADTIEH